MYTRSQREDGGAYIPQSYRGNALYFESIPSEQGECECEAQATPCEPKRDADGILSKLKGILSGDSLIILTLLAFLLFSGKEKGDDNTVILLLLLLLM